MPIQVCPKNAISTVDVFTRPEYVAGSFYLKFDNTGCYLFISFMSIINYSFFTYERSRHFHEKILLYKDGGLQTYIIYGRCGDSIQV